MERDMDLIRDLLLKIAGGQKMFPTLSSDEASILRITLETPMTREEAEKLKYHLDLLEQRGLIEIEMRSSGYLVKGLTWQGHDFLDSIRDPAIWEKAKNGASSAGGWTVDLLKDLAKGLVKKQIEEYTGVKL